MQVSGWFFVPTPTASAHGLQTGSGHAEAFLPSAGEVYRPKAGPRAAGVPTDPQ
jgi:hypothetical protein